MNWTFPLYLLPLPPHLYAHALDFAPDEVDVRQHPESPQGLGFRRRSNDRRPGWHRTLDDPIPLPDGGDLRTLSDAGNYIAKLPKREHNAPAWLAATQALMLVVERGGDTMLPRIGIMRALYPSGVPLILRKKRPAKKYRVVG
jgi:hypothetical protein